MSLSDWDLDFRRGGFGESILSDIVYTAEVKTDYGWKKTGNLYVETECFYKKFNEYRPSGLSVSKASYYAFVLPKDGQEPIIISLPTDLLKRVINEKGRKIQCVISDNPSRGYLIKITDILSEYLKGE